MPTAHARILGQGKHFNIKHEDFTQTQNSLKLPPKREYLIDSDFS